MPAALILALARVIRCAIVVSWTRKACAISATVSPPTIRSVSATRASIASAGCAQVKSIRSRSSSMAPTARRPESVVVSICASSCFASRRPSRRTPVEGLVAGGGGEPAAGVGGTPWTGQCSRAVAKASAAASSAMSRSPNRRARVATTRAHSSRWTRAMTSRGRASLTRSRRRVGPRSCGCTPSSRRRPASTRRRGRRPRSPRSPRGTPWSPTNGPSVTRLARPGVHHGGGVERARARRRRPSSRRPGAAG